MKFIERLFQLRSDKPKPLLAHLEDVRWMFIKMAITLVIAMGGCLIFQKELVLWLEAPLLKVDPSLVSKLQNLSVIDPITIAFSLAFYAGIVFSFPLLFFFVAQFLVPALTHKEKKVVLPAILAGFALFAGGVLLCYYAILPPTLKFCFDYSHSLQFTPAWTVRDYFAFVTRMLLCFGAASQLPVVVLTLVYLKVLSTTQLRKTRPYACILIMILAAIIAPTPDPITFMLLCVPMYFLYESCIWISLIMEKRHSV